MTSPQQPQPQPQPEHGGNDTGGRGGPMPPAPPMPPTAPPGPPPQGRQPGPPEQQERPAPQNEAGTMMLQAQQAPEPPAAKEAGTMMLQAQPLPDAQQIPAPQPLSAHGPGKEAGTMMLQAQTPAPQQQPPYAGPPQGPPPGQAPQQGMPPQGHPQQQPGANWQGGQAGYVSPIPVRRTHLGHALASEWTKIRSVRSTIWTLGVMIVMVLGVGTLTALGVSANESIGGVSPLFFGFSGMLLGVLCILPLGVLVISSEYGTGMIRTTLTACPSRGRVLAAKAIIFFALNFVVTTVTTALVAAIDTAFLGDLSTAEITAGEWFKSTVGIGLYVSLLGLVSLGVGSLIRHSAGAITIMIGVVLLPFVLAMFMLTESLKDVQNFLLGFSIPNQLTVMYGGKFPFVDGGPSDWDPLWIVMGLAAVALGGAYAAMRQRDV